MYNLKKSHDEIKEQFINEDTYQHNPRKERIALKRQLNKKEKIRTDKEEAESSSSSDDEEDEDEESSSEDEEQEESSSEDEESDDEEQEKSSSEDEKQEESSSEDEESDDESEDEDDQINRNTIYEYDGKKYTIDNEKFLQKRFDDIKPETTYKMNMCIYKCIRTGITPYLSYLLKYDDQTKTYILPNYAEIQPASDSASQEESVEDVEERYMNVFKETLFEIYPPSETLPSEESTDLYDEDLFKGFFLNDNEITMVYDATRVNSQLDSNMYCWVSPYEIFVSQKMKSIPISKTVEQTFDKIANDSSNRFDFYHLKQLPENTIVKTPYILFMCKGDSSYGFSILDIFNSNKITYSTVETSDSDSETETETIIYPTIQHPSVGNYTLFSFSPFSTSNLVKRFAVFIDTDDLHPLYIQPNENDKLLTLYDIDAEQYTSITFIENGSQMCCVKSPMYFSEMQDNGNYLLESENIEPMIQEGDVHEEPENPTEEQGQEPENPADEQGQEPENPADEKGKEPENPAQQKSQSTKIMK